MASLTPEQLEQLKACPRPDAEDVAREVNLEGTVAIVTGAGSGIGEETARVLALRGATVIMAVRDLSRCQPILEKIVESTGNSKVESMLLDIASLKSVEEFVHNFRSKYSQLNLLIENAGIMATPFSQTVDGFESQFGTNHIGHFHLGTLLAELMVTSAPARLVVLSSIAHRRSPVLFDDINFKATPYNPWIAYGQSKTANALFAIEFNRRYADQGVFAFAVHPGGIATGLQKHLGMEEQIAMGWYDVNGNINPVFKTVSEGAATTIFAALSPELEGKGGHYLENCMISTGPSAIPFTGVQPYAIDPENARRLWDISEKLIADAKAGTL